MKSQREGADNPDSLHQHPRNLQWAGLPLTDPAASASSSGPADCPVPEAEAENTERASGPVISSDAEAPLAPTMFPEFNNWVNFAATPCECAEKDAWKVTTFHTWTDATCPQGARRFAACLENSLRLGAGVIAGDGKSFCHCHSSKHDTRTMKRSMALAQVILTTEFMPLLPEPMLQLASSMPHGASGWDTAS